jgi:hypothetical protein
VLRSRDGGPPPPPGLSPLVSRPGRVWVPPRKRRTQIA